MANSGQGRGSAIEIEDGYVLAIVASYLLKKPSKVIEQWRLCFNEIQANRANVIQILSNTAQEESDKKTRGASLLRDV